VNDDARHDIFEARYSIPKLLVALAGTLLFVALGPLLLRAGSWIAASAAVLGTVFFGFAALVFLRRLFDRRVQIRVDAKGVMVREWSDQIIAHRSIKSVRDMGRFLAIFLHKPEKYPTSNAMRRFLLRIGGDFQRSAGDIYVVKFQYDRSADAIVEAMARMRPRTAFEERVDELVQAALAGEGAGPA
jgi:hypothetical protein